MNFTTILTLLIVGGIVWGGFLFFLFKAIKFESLKKQEEN